MDMFVFGVLETIVASGIPPCNEPVRFVSIWKGGVFGEAV
jgi:hypothetical protein